MRDDVADAVGTTKVSPHPESPLGYNRQLRNDPGVSQSKFHFTLFWNRAEPTNQGRELRSPLFYIPRAFPIILVAADLPPPSMQESVYLASFSLKQKQKSLKM